ncbi:MAG: B12-binding domain-containing radical SAM protein [Treponema sp.]|nr:B12-binding domain-containing radical SAM protein [Treponema sp.]
MSEIVLATINAKWIHPSLALRLLKANLKEYENQTLILEFALRQPLQEKLEPILAARPRILGLSVSIWNHTAVLELLKALEQQWGIPGKDRKPAVVLGGPEASHLPAEAEIIAHADYVIRGDGELAFRDLCRRILGSSVSLLNGSAQSRPGKFIDAPPVNPADIDPAYRLYTDEDLTRKLTYVEASRGCPFGCEFCLSSVEYPGAGGRGGSHRPLVREFPLETFLGEMEKLINRGGRSFKFLDRSFNLNPERARRIMAFFLEHISKKTAKGTPQMPGLYVHFEIFPALFTPELRELARRFPPESLRLELGVQTFNRRTAALVRRPGDGEKELEALDFLRRETGAIVHADLIAGLPGEDFASFAAGFDRLWQVRPREIQLGILKCLPGTPLHRHCEAYGIRYAAEPPYEVLETAALPEPDLNRIKNFARFWEIIVNRDAFPDLVPVLCPEGESMFRHFMQLSDRLLRRFGRNWGIDRRELREAVAASIPAAGIIPFDLLR